MAGIFVEKEMVITNAMKPTADWWDKNALPAKADVVVIPKYRKPFLRTQDWQRGDSDDFQLRRKLLGPCSALSWSMSTGM